MPKEDFERCPVCKEPRNMEDLTACDDCEADEFGESPLVGECCWIEHEKGHK